MSYILDALKKSEQDRGNGSIPNVQTIHSSALNYHQEKPALWPWILTAALAINGFALIYFLTLENRAETEKLTTGVSIETIDLKAQKNTEKTISSSKPSAKVMVTATEKPINNINRTKSVVDIDALPENIRRHVPDMIFSAHVYSSNPVQRSLVINNRFMEEGEAFSHDLMLVEITRNGAVFDFRDYRFSTSILTGWSSH